MIVTIILHVVIIALVPTDAASLVKRNKRQSDGAVYTSSGFYSSVNDFQPATTYPPYADVTHDIITGDVDNSKICNVTITVNAEIEDSNGCAYDRLVLWAGQNSINVCGSVTDQVYSFSVTKGESLHIEFISDESVQSRGYRLDYTVTCTEYTPPPFGPFTGDTTIIPGGRALNGYESEIYADSGVFQSPNFPQDYEAGWDLSYIAHTSSSKIHLEFVFDIEEEDDCLFDFLEIVTADDNIRLCGNNQSGQLNITVANNDLEVFFHTDYSVNFRGFRLKFYTIDRRLSRRTSFVNLPSWADNSNGPTSWTDNSVTPPPSAASPVDSINNINVFLPDNGQSVQAYLYQALAVLEEQLRHVQATVLYIQQALSQG